LEAGHWCECFEEKAVVVVVAEAVVVVVDQPCASEGDGRPRV